MEPIAIIGCAGRFPGAADIEAYWRVLNGIGEALAEVPATRFDIEAFFDPRPGTSGKAYARRGGFLAEIDRFDHLFFGMTAREAVAADPQQRLLLETAWHALDDAALVPAALAGSRTGVFFGLSTWDYNKILNTDVRFMDAHAAAGSTLCIAANRLSHLLDLRGPSMAIDTACSSSLVAVHLGCQSLHSGESRLALVGGANLIVSPESSIVLSQAGMLAPDGRCKTFDAAADGYVRSEGCAVFVLKRLADAQADGDPIWGVIRGSAVNHNGKSNGLAAPSGPAQQALIVDALARAAVLPADVGYVETHGTGTRLGDPIEVGALRAVYAPPALARGPLALGAAKAVIGHAEAAAGAGGLLKVLLAMRHQLLPAQPPIGTVNPLVAAALKDSAMAILTVPTPWPAGSGRRLAGVSSFGFGGANAHLIVEAADHHLRAPAPAGAPRARLLPLSARTEPALRELARRSAQWLLDMPAEQSLADVCHTAQTGRSHFPYRLCVTGAEPAALAAALTRLADDPQPMAVKVARGPFRPAFVFSGQGTLHAGVARGLLHIPALHAVLARCDAVVREQAGWSLFALLETADDDAELNATGAAQPLLYALQCALAQTMIDAGVTPSALLGHSLGEYSAAWVAGVFSLEDGVRLVLERARLMTQLCAAGAMLAVDASEAALRALLAPWPEQIEIACHNGVDALVLAGPSEALARCQEQLAAAGARVHPLATSHAFHTRMMAPAAEAYAGFAARLEYAAPRHPLVSSVTGELLDGGTDWPAHWAGQICAPVQYGRALATLDALAPCAVLELGAHPVLHALARAAGVTLPWITSLRRGHDERAALLAMLGECHRRGARLNWEAVADGAARRIHGFPGYPFERHRHWVDVAAGWNLLAATPAGAPVPALQLPQWQACDTPPAGADAATTLILCGPDSPLNRFALERRGAAVTVWPSAAGRDAQGERVIIAADRPELVVALVRDMGGAGSLRLIVSASYFGAPGADADPAALATACHRCATLLALLAEAAPPIARAWLVSEAAQSAGQRAGGASAAALWGLFKTALAEYPQRFAGLLDIGGPDDATDAALHACLSIRAATPVWALCQGQLYREQLQPAPTTVAPFRARADAAYLIGGAFGGVGLALAQHLLSQGARALILQARRAPSAPQQEQIDGWRAAGARIELIVDAVLREDAVMHALERLALPLAGLFHLAAARADAPLGALAASDWLAALRAKLDPVPVLRRLARRTGADALVYFSSIASLVGSPAQANYVAANCALEALARADRHAGLPATCILWGPWADAGAAAQLSAAQRQRLERHGLRPLAPASALAMLDAALGSGQAVCLAVDADWARLADSAPHLAWLAGPDAGAEPAVAAPLPPWAAMPPPQRLAAVLAILRATLGETLGMPVEPHTDGVDIFAQGLDSLLLMEWLGRLQRRLGFTLYPREAYQRPTLAALGAYLTAELDAPVAPPAPAAPAVVGAPARHRPAPPARLAPAVFLLSAPRSGSTLLRAMLAGHGALFAPPELHLLQFAGMRERQHKLAGSGLDEGLVRALMALCALDADGARARIDAWVAADLPTATVYGALQELAGDRMLIDKSPSYALHPDALPAIGAWFEQPRYIHLTREPHAMAESFERMRMHRIFGDGDGQRHDGESVWQTCNANLLALQATVAPDQWLRVAFEDLVRQPEATLRRLCDFLALPFEPALLEPHAPGRMTDPVRQGGAQVGDPNFHQRHGIDATLARFDGAARRPLAAATQRVARALGYAPDPAADGDWLAGCTERWAETARGRISVCEWGPAAGRPILLLHGWQDQGAAWAAVARVLAGHGHRVLAPDLRLHGRARDAGAAHPSTFDFVGDIAALIADLGPVHVVGHSFGAIVAAMLAACADACASLTLVEPILPEDGATLAPLDALRRHLADGARAPAPARYASVAALAERLRPGFGPLPDQALQALAQRIAEPADGAYLCPALEQGGARLVAALRDTDRARYCDLLSTLQAPLLWLRGAHSRQRRPRDEQRLHAALPPARVVDLDGGHNLHIDCPIALADALLAFIGQRHANDGRAGFAITT